MSPTVQHSKTMGPPVALGEFGASARQPSDNTVGNFSNWFKPTDAADTPNRRDTGGVSAQAAPPFFPSVHVDDLRHSFLRVVSVFVADDKMAWSRCSGTQKVST